MKKFLVHLRFYNYCSILLLVKFITISELLSVIEILYHFFCSMMNVLGATALDIRFKSLKSIPKAKRPGVWTLLKNLMQDVELVASSAPKKPKRASAVKLSLFDPDSSDSDPDECTSDDAVATELSLYRSIQSDEDFSIDPLMYWSTKEASFPRLSVLAKRYLSLPATSVPVERIFSVSAEILNKKRNALLPEHANILLCVHS